MNNFYSKNITQLREKLGLTKDELARSVDEYSILISQWEAGEKEPTDEQYQKLSVVLKASVDDIKNKNMQIQQEKVYSSKAKKFNDTTLSSLLVGSVWLVAVILFCILQLALNVERAWVTFIYAIPVSCVVLAVKYAISHEKLVSPKFTTFMSIFVWSLALALFLNFMTTPNMWIVFLFPIPLQVVLIALAKLKQ